MSRRGLDWPDTLSRIANLIVLALLIFWTFKTALRVVFPWDLYFWPESPFLTDLLKIENHLPVYSSPADGNSFVYSPGLEYLCYGILKPFGLELDIRYSRLIVIALAISGAVFAALAMSKVVFPSTPFRKKTGFFFIGWGIILLSISRNFLADTVHPDNLHAFHALLIFHLAFKSVEDKSFSLALLTMLLSGIGVLAKQTEGFSMMGAFLYFLISKRFGRKQTIILLFIGAATMAASIYLLWLPEYARFYTMELTAKQGLNPHNVVWWIIYMLRLNAGLGLFLCAFAIQFFWQSGGIHRRYLQCWMCLGCFTVMPALAAYLKMQGMPNNLALFRTWIWLLVFPMFRMLLERLKSEPKGSIKFPFLNFRPRISPLCVLAVISLLFLFPLKRVPHPGNYTYATAVQAAVSADLQKGQTVLVPHGASMLIRAGSRKVPLDQANSILELRMANLVNLSGMSARINARYYHHIYLTVGYWYGTNLMADIDHNYQVESVIKTTAPEATSADQGFQGGLMSECQVLRPKD